MLTALIIVPLFGCAASLPEPEYTQFKEMCAKDGGLRINQTVENVSGFIDAGDRFEFGPNWVDQSNEGCTGRCFEALLNDGYRYVEARVSGKSGIIMLASAPGLYRFELSETDDPDCRLFRRGQESGKYGWALRPENMPEGQKNKCISSSATTHFQSHLVVQRVIKRLVKNEKGAIYVDSQEVIDLESGQVLATSKQFMFGMGQYHRLPLGRYLACPSGRVQMLRLKDIIKPKP